MPADELLRGHCSTTALGPTSCSSRCGFPAAPAGAGSAFEELRAPPRRLRPGRGRRGGYACGGNGVAAARSVVLRRRPTTPCRSGPAPRTALLGRRSGRRASPRDRRRAAADDIRPARRPPRLGRRTAASCRHAAAHRALPRCPTASRSDACADDRRRAHRQRQRLTSGASSRGSTLADFLREDLGLTGTHLGCEHGVCGACTVLVDGEAVRSCLMLAVQADGAEVDDRRGPGAADGKLASAAAGLPRAPRPPVRLLHAGHAADRARRCCATNPEPDRGGDPRGPVRQPLPLHRLPGRSSTAVPGRRPPRDRRRRPPPAPSASSGRASSGPRTRASSPAAAASSTTSSCPACSTRLRSQPDRPRADHVGIDVSAAPPRGRVRRLHRPRPEPERTGDVDVPGHARTGVHDPFRHATRCAFSFRGGFSSPCSSWRRASRLHRRGRHFAS